MINRTVRKVISLVAALCLALTAGAGALAEGAQDMADFEALTPLMDLVCAASQYSPNAPESVPGADGVLTVSFTDAFFKVGQTYGAEVGVTADMIKPGAVVVDVGITRVPSDRTKSGWKLLGDVKFDEVAPECSYITPVPGGVGPMTIISLMKNTLKAGRGEVYGK